MLTDTLTQDLKAAMLAKDRVRTRTIRSLRAALLEKEIALRAGGEAEVSDEVAVAVLKKQAKQRRDSIAQFEKADREDLAVTEREELVVIQSYLPEQLSEEEIRREVLAVIEETGASSMKDMGQVMGPVMSRLKGKADGRIVRTVVKESLSS
ncbi:MAG: GatB/YqeY domain-containing protein [Rhodothermia bacterium]|nr:MAG: GatB/YqeY domain-containing protein [Rhodothermia bacterium]